jgi:diguanylate cyclase (GGDEF)-like protein
VLHYADTLPPEDPRLLEALMAAGSRNVRLARGDGVEEIARRIEALRDRVPLARPAAMLLRAQWLDAHGEPAKAERQLIEARPLLPADPPFYLHLRQLVVDGDLKRRRGHLDEALARYDEALRLVDASSPDWRRADLRNAIVSLLREAGQNDKAAEMLDEEMRLANAAHDEMSLSIAWTSRAILLSAGTDHAATLAAWRAALEHAQRSGSQRTIVLAMANIADYYLEQADYPTAYDESMRALAMARQMNSERAASVALGNAGLALIAMKRKDEGVPLVEESLAIDERSGTAHGLAESVRELGNYLERAGYRADALQAYRRFERLAADLKHEDRQRALIEQEESFANEGRQHELDMLARDGRLQDEALRHHALEGQLWAAAGFATLLLCATVAVLARRLRARNRQLRVSNEQLRLQAEIDPLTGLANRRHLQARMAARTGGIAGALYLIDVDHFKEINDACGHAGGDAVLVEIARRLRAALHEDDLVVRWGGEEFLVLARAAAQADAEALAGRLVAALAGAPVMHEGRPVAVSASIGHGVFPMRCPAGPAAAAATMDIGWERAITLVDSAMYEAKAHGRNGACGLRAIVAADLSAVEEIGRNLESAWRDGRAELHFQAGPPLGGTKP